MTTTGREVWSGEKTLDAYGGTAHGLIAVVELIASWKVGDDARLIVNVVAVCSVPFFSGHSSLLFDTTLSSLVIH